MEYSVTENNVDNSASVTWREALMRSPGPRSWWAALVVFVKGVLMGAADIVPGVSGGTIAFITGIYDDFINAVASVDAKFVKNLGRRAGKEALAGVHCRFLFCLIAGILTAVVLFSGIITRCIDKHPVPTWALFLGLILGSVVIVFRAVEKWNAWRAVLLLAGGGFAWWICGLIPVSTPETLPYYFFCGAVAICAMALPGISGSFLLLILGKYYNVFAAIQMVKNGIKTALGGDVNAGLALLFTPGDQGVAPFWLLATLACGIVCGIVFFSRFLKWLLARWHAATMCVLAGMMLGALRKIWPWKQQIRLDCLHGAKGETYKVIEENLVTPAQFAQPYVQTITDKTGAAVDKIHDIAVAGQDPQLGLALGMLALGVVLVVVIEIFAVKIKEKNA